MLVFHEFDAPNVLPLDSLLARLLLQRHRRIRNIRERPRDFRRVHFDHLNLLACLKRFEVLPGRQIALGPRSAWYSQNANQEQ